MTSFFLLSSQPDLRAINLHTNVFLNSITQNSNSYSSNRLTILRFFQVFKSNKNDFVPNNYFYLLQKENSTFRLNFLINVIVSALIVEANLVIKCRST